MRDRRDIHIEAKLTFCVLAAALSFAPGALAQSQSQSQAAAQSSSPAAQQGQSGSGSQTQGQAPDKEQGKAQKPAGSSSANNEPKMQSQEAPPPESLGEAARRAKAQKSQAASGKVYTEDKLAGLSSHGVSVVGDESQASDASSTGNPYGQSAAGGAASGGEKGGKSDEQYWRGKVRPIREQMAQVDDRIAKLQEEIAKYGAVSFDPATGLQQNVIYVKDRNAQIRQAEDQKAKLQSQLDFLEEEGRKAGADPGWFR